MINSLNPDIEVEVMKVSDEWMETFNRQDVSKDSSAWAEVEDMKEL